LKERLDSHTIAQGVKSGHSQIFQSPQSLRKPEEIGEKGCRKPHLLFHL
jgi:hypothetical protein